MAALKCAKVALLGVAGLAAGCATRSPSAPPSTASASLHGAGDMANQTAQAGWDTMGQTYTGMGGAMREPFRDFGLLNKSIPAVLARARINPYDTRGLTSCDDVLQEVAALDVVLGPDLDNPEVKGRKNRYTSGADMAADAALQAAKDAVDHFIPMRGTIRTLSGATRAEAKQRKSQLAGNIRRGFLKSVGMAHNCSWPAAPMDFTPAPGGPLWPKLMEARTSGAAGRLQIASFAPVRAPRSSAASEGSILGPSSAGPPLALSATSLDAGAGTPSRPAAPSSWRIGRATDTGSGSGSGSAPP